MSVLGGRGGRHVLDSKLNRGEFLRPGSLEFFDGVQHQFVELVTGAAGDRNPDRRDRATQPTAVSVPPAPLTPDGGHAGTRRLIALHEK